MDIQVDKRYSDFGPAAQRTLRLRVRARAGGEFCILQNREVAVLPWNQSGPLAVIDRVGGHCRRTAPRREWGTSCGSVAAPPVAVAQLARPTCAAMYYACVCPPPPSPSHRAGRFENKQTVYLSRLRRSLSHRQPTARLRTVHVSSHPPSPSHPNYGAPHMLESNCPRCPHRTSHQIF